MSKTKIVVWLAQLAEKLLPALPVLLEKLAEKWLRKKEPSPESAAPPSTPTTALWSPKTPKPDDDTPPQPEMVDKALVKRMLKAAYLQGRNDAITDKMAEADLRDILSL